MGGSIYAVNQQNFINGSNFKFRKMKAKYIPLRYDFTLA